MNAHDCAYIKRSAPLAVNPFLTTRTMHKNKLISTFYARSLIQASIRLLRVFLFRSATLKANNRSQYTEGHRSFSTALLPAATIRLSHLLITLLLFSISIGSTAHASTTNEKSLPSPAAQTSDGSDQSQAESPAPPLAKTDSIIVDKTSTGEYVSGEVIVIFHNDLRRSAQVEASHIVQNIPMSVSEEIDLRGLDKFLGDSGTGDGLAMTSGYRPAQILQVPAGRENEIIAQLRENPAVAFAIRNQIVRAAGAPIGFTQEAASSFQADWYGAQASTQRTMLDADLLRQSDANTSANTIENRVENIADFEVNDPYFESQWYMSRIHMLQAWALTLSGTDSSLSAIAGSLSHPMHPVKVAIIDSGIDHLHPEFSGRILKGKNYFAPGKLPIDDYGHGTHVAGLIAASVNNEIGIAGVAPLVEILPYKTLDGLGNGTISNVTKAIRDATDAGADIINLSLETGAPDVLMEAAVDYAESHDVLLIASVGNLAPAEVRWPAASKGVIGVAATTETNAHAEYSCTGAEVDIAAPGGTNTKPIRSTWSSFAECPGSAEFDPAIGSYCYARGTSMSTGLVSGVAALMLGIDPDLSSTEIRERLLATAFPLSAHKQTEVGSGLLNADDATRLTVTSELQVAASANIRVIEEGAEPYSVTLSIQNPSLDVVQWEANWQEQSWLTVTTVVSGSVQFGIANTLAFSVTPTALEPQFYNTIVTLTGIRGDGTKIIERVAINVVVEEATAPDGQTTASQLAFTIDHSDADISLKRSDAPRSLQFIIRNDEAATVTWELDLSPTEGTNLDWLTTPEAVSGVLPPRTTNRIVVTIDPSTLDVGTYSSTLTISAAEQTSSRVREVSTEIALEVMQGEFRAMLPTMLR